LLDALGRRSGCVALQPEMLPDLASGVAQVALALVLLRLGFTNRANRALALVLALRGIDETSTQLGAAADRAADAAFWAHIGVYCYLARLLGLAYFVAVYPRTRAALARLRVPAMPFLAGMALLDGLYALDHGLDAAPSGPLFLVSAALLLMFPLAALVFARDYLRAPRAPEAGSVLLVSLAFALIQLYDDLVPTGRLLLGLPAGSVGNDIAYVPALAVRLAAWALLVGIVARRAAHVPRDPNLRRYLGALGILGASAAAVLAVARGEGPLHTFLTGFWDLGLPVLVTYALVRHQIFGLDYRVKWTIRKGTVAGIILGVVLVVSQVAQNYLAAYGPLAGGVAAGMLIFTLNPLQRVAERVADAAMPGTRGGAELSRGEREEVYRRQLGLAWTDGLMTVRERRLLDQLREDLGLPAEVALRLEREAREVATRPAAGVAR
jgi:hypothetical protein